VLLYIMLTIMFVIGGCALLARMALERRRDVLHGPYVRRDDNLPLSRSEREEER
jgi:hypothetical protein